MLRAGDKAPNASADDDQGARVALKSLRGKPFVVWFYPKADTPG
jgi:peroxiredoxin Q/BCP